MLGGNEPGLEETNMGALTGGWGVTTVDAALCRAVEQRFVPLWLTTVFAPVVSHAFDELGVGPAERYFATRAAPLGPVSAPVVVATFFNFSPAAVSMWIPAVWVADGGSAFAGLIPEG